MWLGGGVGVEGRQLGVWISECGRGEGGGIGLVVGMPLGDAA